MLRNTIAFSVAAFVTMAFSFVLAPIMLARLGLEQFGVWAVVGAFTAYAALADLGINRALGRYVAIFHTKGDRRGVEQCLGLGLIATTVVGLLIAALAFALAPVAAHALGDVLSPGEMRVVLLAAVGILVTLGYRSAFDAVPYGLARYVPPAVADMASAAVNFALSVGALVVSRDLAVYAVANAVAGVVGVAFSVVAMRRVWGRVAFALPPRALVREILGFSTKSQVSWVAELVNAQAAKIVLALFVDVRAAGAYDVAARAASAAKQIGILSMSAVFPTATAEVTRRGAEVVGELYRRFTVRAMSVTVPFVVLLCAGAPAMLVAWLGDVPGDALAIFIALTLANGVSLTGGVANQLALVEGRAGMLAWISSLTAGLTIVAMFALAPLLGLWGVVAAILVGIVTGVVVFLVRYHRLHQLPPRLYVRSVGPPIAIALLAATPLLLWWLASGVPVDDRASAVPMTLALTAVFVAVYWPLATRLELLPEQLRVGEVARRALTVVRRGRPARA